MSSSSLSLPGPPCSTCLNTRPSPHFGLNPSAAAALAAARRRWRAVCGDLVVDTLDLRWACRQLAGMRGPAPSGPGGTAPACQARQTQALRSLLGRVAGAQRVDASGRQAGRRWRTYLTDGALEVACGLRQLTSLCLRLCTNITDAGLAHVSRARALRSLDLAGCGVSDAGLAAVGRLPQLTFLSLRDCRRVTDAGLAHVARLPQLQHLDLAHCDQITDAGLARVGQLQELTFLGLREVDEVTDAGLAHVARLRKLAALDLQECHLVTGAGLAHIASLAALTSLDLNHCDKVGDGGLRHLAALPRLASLRLRGCFRITDAGLGCVAELQTLTTLELHGTMTRAAARHTRAHTHLLSVWFLFRFRCMWQFFQRAFGRQPWERASGPVGYALGAPGLARAHRYLCCCAQRRRWSAGCALITDAGIALLGWLPCLVSLGVRSCPLVTSGSWRPHKPARRNSL